MAYLPIRSGARINPQGQTSLMGKKGVNIRDLPQLLNVEYALEMKNFYVTADGGLIKRSGIQKIEDIAGLYPVKFLLPYTPDLLIYAYDNKLAVYDRSTGTSTVINTYSSAFATFSGDRYGDYFFVTNGTDEIGRVSRILAYDGQTVNFTVGKKITGATSGATAIILQDADSGSSGTLTLGSVEGVFLDDETITDSSGGTALVNGVLGWGFNTISGSPICRVLRVIGNRLHAGGLLENLAAVWYSEADSGGNPPFTTWTPGTNQSNPGKIYFRNAGEVYDIKEYGQNIVLVLAEFGKWAFYISVVDSAGTLKKVDEVVLQKVDFGGRNGVMTDRGFFYVNKAGLWNLVSLGQPNIPFSKQEMEETLLLGNNFFKDVDLSNSSIAYDPTRKLILLTCAKDSSVNNLVVVYNVEFKAISFFTGWSISRFADVNGEIYAGSANSTKLYKVFEGNNDDGAEIWAEFYQEVKLGELSTRDMLKDFYIQGFLSSSSDVEISFDIYDKNGNFIYRKTVWNWTAQTGSSSLSDGFGVASWGTASWSGNIDISNTIEAFDGCTPRIANFQRVRVRIKENSRLPFAVNWFSMGGRVKAKIRRRKITKLS